MQGAIAAIASIAIVTVGVLISEAPAEGAGESGGERTIPGAGTRASIKGPAGWFTGAARIDPLFPSNETAHFSGVVMTEAVKQIYAATADTARARERRYVPVAGGTPRVSPRR